MASAVAPGILARGVIGAGFENDRLGDLAAFGGYVLFAANGSSVERVREVTDTLRKRCTDGVPPLVAIDQEGGRVARLREGCEPMPSMMALAATGDLELAQRAGEQTAFDLRRAGCTFDFAPVLDLALDPRNTVIGTRSFGSDPSAVAAFGQRFALGLQRGGIVSCYKHFPGHGSTKEDSHVTMPVVDVDAATLRARDIAPFASVAPSAPAIMGAHVLVCAFDAQRPASLSPAIARGLLRDELGFSGAYVTDCLEMGAVSESGGTVDAAIAALVAGADLLLVSHSTELADAIAVAIERAVDDGGLPIARLQEAYERVMQLRRAAQSPLPLDAFPPHPGVGREIARRAVTVVRGMPHADPTASIAVEFMDESAGGAEDAIRVALSRPMLAREVRALQTVRCSPDGDNTETVLQALGERERRPILLARRAHLHPKQVLTIANVVDRYPDAVVVSMLEPYDVPLFDKARHVLATYGDDAAAVGGLADVLFGGIMAQGRLPVELSTVAPS